MPLSRIGELLQFHRRARKLTQLHVASAIGVSVSLISLIERGGPTEHLRTIENFAEVVGADISQIREELVAVLPTLRAMRRPQLAAEIAAFIEQQNTTEAA